MNYTIFHNLDAGFSRGYQQGDRLVKGHEGDVDVSVRTTSVGLNAVYERHNRDDRPDGQTAPSLSVGDVVLLGETAFTVAWAGFDRVDVDPDDLVPGTYLEAR